jgi:tetratricopeptide (TPR) repeat protein
MQSPVDVHNLMLSLLELDVDRGLVAKAEGILTAKADDIGEWIELAFALRQRGDFHGALETYDVAMQRFPDSHMLWHNRGVVLLDWERYDEALEHFSASLRIKPDYIFAVANMASTYERLHEFQKAANAFQRVVELDPNYGKAWNSLGLCFQQDGDLDQARQSYEKAVTAEPGFRDPLFNLAALLSSQRRYAEALPWVNKLLAIDPDDRSAADLREEILLEPEEPRNLGVRDIYKERRIFRLARREGSDPRFSSPADVELVSFTVRTPSNMAYGAPIPTPGIWDKQEVMEIVRKVIAEGPPPPPFDEPNIFISYRWESAEHNQWVARLVGDLETRGYRTVYDGDLRRLATPPSVPELVARMASCNFFMPILTEPYRRRVELAANDVAVKEDGWVFDEWQLALKLLVIDRLKITGVWRSGPVVPLPLAKDRVFDFRDPAAYPQLVEHCFPRLSRGVRPYISQPAP